MWKPCDVGLCGYEIVDTAENRLFLATLLLIYLILYMMYFQCFGRTNHCVSVFLKF